ncbi:methylenetetrahydrofolate reductase [NAD(P)H] [bacterium AH-315-C07]|nr:methylenetetrahydrofolate reductase [NAD(P)H] [bacterium AH-315-C07]
MKVTEHLKNSKETFMSFEILPPLAGTNIQHLYDALDALMEFKPPYIDVTYHREEFVYQQREGKYLEKVAVRKRPGTVGICAAIMNRYKVDAVPHIICGGFSKVETENALIDLSYLGIDNVLVIRGDSRKDETTFVPEETGNNYASDLLEQVLNMNQGIYLEEDIQDASSTNFCTGVAGYPEKHFEAPNMVTDLNFLKKKIEMGADYIVTQMFFNNKKYFDFVDQCKANDINVPIIPGLKPISTINQVHTLPAFFHIDIPNELAAEVMKCKDNKAARIVGIEWTVNQCKELMEHNVPCLHFYTMSKAKQTGEIVKQLV